MTNYKNFNDDQKKEYWSKHIKQFKISSLSQKKYCEQENLSYWSFRTWYYKAKPEIPGKKFIKLENPYPIKKSAAEITITLYGKIRIDINEDISEEVLHRIFKASEVLNV
jgi:hypothetical protein